MFAPLCLLSLLAPVIVLVVDARPRVEAARAQELTWPQLVARDARLEFTARTAFRAARDLDAGDLRGRAREEALMALALGGARRELPRLESSALEGSREERCAAVLALGELGGGVRARLLELFADPEPEVAECALLAALRLDPDSMRGRVDRIAGDPAHPLADEARRILLFSIDAAAAPPSRAALRLLELRHGAARRYGLIDGEPFDLHFLRRLVADQAFLDQVVLRGAAELSDPGVADQILGHLLERGGDAALRAAARGMPQALADLILHGLWTPTADDWGPILEEIGRDRHPRGVDRLLQVALEQAPRRMEVLELQARTGELGELGPLIQDQAALSRADQVELAAILGSSDSAAASAPLRELTRSPDEAVRAAAFLNRARLGELEGHQEVRRVLLDPEHPAWPIWLPLAVRFAHDPRLHEALEGALRQLEPGPERLTLLTALAAQGHAESAELLRAELLEGIPSGPAGVAAVRALGQAPTLETRELFARLLPVEDRPEVNVELALGLIRGRDASVLPVLRSAIWSDPFERSVLAAALALRVGGRHALRQELDRLPRTASMRDLRRVGFAMGLFGGVEEAQWLAMRRGGGSGDPAVQGAYLGALAGRTF